MEIRVFDGDINKAVKVLKRKLQQDGLFREIRNRKFYEKPSIKRRRKAKESQRRLRKKMKRLANR
ncbi:30S ribosomal protein S21 [Pelobacter seleniigenes]|uniref:30S ribosomal protein S21 n=1 Tax=Pelobacter seleniigenes TaxID=407188 RepID=UPI0004A6EDE4|nr:30S ribosomal protein S21 [Pelobacter seleniigenes]